MSGVEVNEIQLSEDIARAGPELLKKAMALVEDFVTYSQAYTPEHRTFIILIGIFLARAAMDMQIEGNLPPEEAKRFERMAQLLIGKARAVRQTYVSREGDVLPVAPPSSGESS